MSVIVCVGNQAMFDPAKSRCEHRWQLIAQSELAHELQVIVEDYVHGEGLKLASQIAIALACAAVGFASVYAVVKISLGR